MRSSGLHKRKGFVRSYAPLFIKRRHVITPSGKVIEQIVWVCFQAYLRKAEIAKLSGSNAPPDEAIEDG